MATEAYGLPADLADSFNMLERNDAIDSELAMRLPKMVGFRDIAVHQYEGLNPKIIDAIVERHLDDLRAFGAAVLVRFGLSG